MLVLNHSTYCQTWFTICKEPVDECSADNATADACLEDPVSRSTLRTATTSDKSDGPPDLHFLRRIRFIEVTTTFFCEALYDSEYGIVPGALRFRVGDIIEIVFRHDNRWWLGLLNDEWGWFPSNHVAVISAEEANAARSAAGDGGMLDQDREDGALHSSLPDSSTLERQPETTSTPLSVSRDTSNPDHCAGLAEE